MTNPNQPLFNAKAILVEEQFWYFLTYSLKCKRAHTFHNVIILVCLYIYIYIYKVNWPTVVESDPKSPFSIATILGVGNDSTPFPWLLHLPLITTFIMLSFKQGGNKYHFLTLSYNLTWNWSRISRAIGKHSNHYTNKPVYIYIYIYI